LTPEKVNVILQLMPSRIVRVVDDAFNLTGKMYEDLIEVNSPSARLMHQS
jgi:hypothetical protein